MKTFESRMIIGTPGPLIKRFGAWIVQDAASSNADFFRSIWNNVLPRKQSRLCFSNWNQEKEEAITRYEGKTRARMGRIIMEIAIYSVWREEPGCFKGKPKLRLGAFGIVKFRYL